MSSKRTVVRPVLWAVSTVAVLAASLLGSVPARATTPGANGLIAWSRPYFFKPAQIWVMKPDGTDKHQLTNSTSNVFDPAWSPDGRTLAFSASGSVGLQNDIYLIDSDGSNQRDISNSTDSSDVQPAWSPDGKRIVFVEDNMDGTSKIVRMNADGSDQHKLTSDDATNLHPAWSPDGSTIVFESNRGDSFDLWAMDRDGANKHQVTNTPDIQEENASWAPDGSRIAFDACQSASYPCPGSPNYEIYTVRPDGSDTTRITFQAGIDANPCFAPNGKAIVFRSDRAPNGTQIWKMNADGSNPFQLTYRNYVGGVDPDWQPRP